mmetsp:Transcript_29149/g.21692  ORF Transcript_29149/g.21692 Transcript_29149/m.21692 type:complete len:84 (+) Transcript_29149:875-1126(+)
MELKKKIFEMPKFLLERQAGVPLKEIEFKEFNLRTEERGKEKENKQVPEEPVNYQFKARKMPTFREPSSPRKSVSSSSTQPVF